MGDRLSALNSVCKLPPILLISWRCKQFIFTLIYNVSGHFRNQHRKWGPIITWFPKSSLQRIWSSYTFTWYYCNYVNYLIWGLGPFLKLALICGGGQWVWECTKKLTRKRSWHAVDLIIIGIVSNNKTYIVDSKLRIHFFVILLNGHAELLL